MEQILDLHKRYTYADYLTWMDDIRRELIEGFIKLLPAPRSIHAKVSFNISWHLAAILKKNKGKCEVFCAPFDVRLPKNGETANDQIYTVVQPDICVICDPAKIDKRGCCGAPDMIIEVISPSTGKRQLFDKFVLYEAPLPSPGIRCSVASNAFTDRSLVTRCTIFSKADSSKASYFELFI